MKRREFLVGLGLAAIGAPLIKAAPKRRVTEEEIRKVISDVAELYEQANAVERAEMRKDFTIIPRTEKSRELCQKVMNQIVEVYGL